MKRFSGFVKKEIYHILRDTRTLVILLGIPIVQVLLFGFAITNEINEAKIAILDHSKDEVTRALTQRLLATDYFLLEENLQSQADIARIFQAGQVKEVIVFESGFAGKLQKEQQAHIQLILDATDPNTATTLQNYTAAIVMDFQQELNQQQALPASITTRSRMYYNPELKSVFFFVPGIITIILMLLSAMMTSISITREKELGTMEVLLASPMQPAQIILGKVTPYILLSLLNALIILALSYYVFQVPVKGNLALLIGESVLFIITALSLGILISTVASTQQVALMASLFALMLPTILLSGFIFPIENMPEILQWISHVIPARYFITIVRGMMLKGAGLDILWKESLILVGFTCLFILISVKKFKIRLE
ncbi:MAG: ABC transporter permease [Bacteroidetes bacterium]|nr:MAG: ABC transporter permease [Bacteroidota bacterium]